MELHCKVILLGDHSVGKTALLHRMITSTLGIHDSTVGAATTTLDLPGRGGTQIRAHVWDTAGQEKFRSLIPMYFIGVDVAVLVFDLSNVASFRNIDDWLGRAQQHGPADARLLLVGNKCDLEAERVIDADVARAKAQEIGACPYVETSARDGSGIEILAETLADAIVARPPITITTPPLAPQSRETPCC
jgi:small GTP-binding protein